MWDWKFEGYDSSKRNIISLKLTDSIKYYRERGERVLEERLAADHGVDTEAPVHTAEDWEVSPAQHLKQEPRVPSIAATLQICVLESAFSLQNQ
jgi:hypothetical protein